MANKGLIMSGDMIEYKMKMRKRMINLQKRRNPETVGMSDEEIGRKFLDKTASDSFWEGFMKKRLRTGWESPGLIPVSILILIITWSINQARVITVALQKVT